MAIVLIAILGVIAAAMVGGVSAGCAMPTESQLKNQLFLAEQRNLSSVPTFPAEQLGLDAAFHTDDCPRFNRPDENSKDIRLRANTPWTIKFYQGRINAQSVRFYPYEFQDAECCGTVGSVCFMKTATIGHVQHMIKEKFLLINSGRCVRGKMVFWPIKIQVSEGCNCAYLPTSSSG